MIDVAVELPPQKHAVLAAAIDALKNASNVVAPVLGGSHARGVAREDSDLDIGIYYREAAPLPVQEVRNIAESKTPIAN
jgi:predicted nucleotidyltransferase